MLKVDNLLQSKIIFRYFTQALNWTQNCLPFFEALFQRVANILVRYFHSFFSNLWFPWPIVLFTRSDSLFLQADEWVGAEENRMDARTGTGLMIVDCPLEFHLKCFRFKMTMFYFLILSMKHLLTKSREEVNLYILLLFLLWYFENDR